MALNRALRQALIISLATTATLSFAQDRWPSMPGYKEFQAAQQASRAVQDPRFRPRWTSADTLEFRQGGETKTFNLTTGQTVTATATLDPIPHPEPQQPARGRQFEKLTAPDGKKVVSYVKGNLYLNEGDMEKQITTEGDLSKKIKYGSGSWVYGEELEQRYAFGFSPDSSKLWFYRFDESPIETYYLTVNQLDQQVTLYPEAYPKPGKNNPIVDLYTYDFATGKMTKVKVRDGEFSNALGHYVYAITWGDDSKELFFHRMDRQQKVKELCAADPATGQIRIVDHTENKAGWIEFMPLVDMPAGRGAPVPLKSKILIYDESDGFFNLYWLDTKSGKRTQITHEKADVLNIIDRDEANKRILYMCADGDTPYRQQLHVVNFDGTGAKKLTDSKYNNAVSYNREKGVVAIESDNSLTPPSLKVIDLNQKVIKDFGQSALPALSGFSPRQWFSFKSFDGTTTLYGTMDFPRNFDPTKKYPVLVDVYGGPLPPGPGSETESWAVSSPMASAGFITVNINGRGQNGRGRAFRQAIYRRMGQVEIDDQAAGVKALAQFPYIDTTRVGIHGTSYGGYASGMCLLRYPDLFAAASCGSMVSQWTNYDTTYTERYMDLYENNKEGYAAGSCMTYAKNLKGWLMIYFGTADDNVHPANTYQLCDALTRAGKFYELQVGVDRGHTGLNMARMMEFFTERLVITGPRQ